MDITFRVVEKETQSTTFCNLKNEFKQLLPQISQPSEIINLPQYGKVRCGIMKTENSLVYFASDAKDYINSSSKFKNDLMHLTALINSFLKDVCQQQIDYQLQRTQRLSHNIRSMNANCITSFFSFFPQEELSRRDNKIQTKIDKIIKDQNLNSKRPLNTPYEFVL